jgi:hypothetical protein
MSDSYIDSPLRFRSKIRKLEAENAELKATIIEANKRIKTLSWLTRARASDSEIMYYLDKCKPVPEDWEKGE